MTLSPLSSPPSTDSFSSLNLQMSPRLRARDPRWFEDRFYTIKVNDIEILFADTSVFVSEYYQ